MPSAIKQFITEERGASAVEYALLIGIISLAIIVGAALLGGHLDMFFRDVADEVDTATP